jgi:hypothetical protein
MTVPRTWWLAGLCMCMVADDSSTAFKHTRFADWQAEFRIQYLYWLQCYIFAFSFLTRYAVHESHKRLPGSAVVTLEGRVVCPITVTCVQHYGEFSELALS